VEEGYKLSMGRKVATVFSAPNYAGGFTNVGAILKVDESLMISFQIMKSAKK
jgi:serine/threonine-protein phosphatase PP1 catalytic subunit